MADEFEEVDIRVGEEIQTLRVPKGTSDEDIQSFVRQQSQPDTTIPEPEALPEGPLGIISPETRADVGQSLEEITSSIPVIGDLPEGIRSLPVQSALPVLGTAGGVALGLATGPLAPVAVPVFAGIGGFTGEILSQELGFSPNSKFAAFMSATGPIAGPAFGRFQKLAKRFFGFAISKSPPARAAIARIQLGDAVKKGKTIGAEILERQTGLLGKKSKVLFRASKIVRAPIEPSDLANTRKALSLLKNEAEAFKSFPEGRQILRTIRQIEDDLLSQNRQIPGGVVQDFIPRQLPPIGQEITEELKLPLIGAEITTESLTRIKQLIGASTRRLEAASGVKFGASKKFFSALSKDVDGLIAGGGRKGKAAFLAKAAGKRAKLEFAVKDLEDLVLGATGALKGEGDAVVISGKRLLENLTKVTDPKSKSFNKNFAEALKDEMPKIVRFFEEVNQVSVVSPGGPGSIVYRGITAGVGATIGGVLGTPLGPIGQKIGAGMGAFAGAQAPEMITSLLLTPGGRKFLKATMKAGTGHIDDLHWAVMAQYMAQGVTPRKSQKREDTPFSSLPLADKKSRFRSLQEAK
jgi:hypothetical protein